MATTTTSKQFTLDSKDFLKGLLLSVITPVITILIQSLNAGSLKFDWKAIGITALSTALAYLAKNFLAPSTVVITDPAKEDVQAVKDGESKAIIVTK